jgi:hypothetical protein
VQGVGGRRKQGVVAGVGDDQVAARGEGVGQGAYRGEGLVGVRQEVQDRHQSSAVGWDRSRVAVTAGSARIRFGWRILAAYMASGT